MSNPDYIMKLDLNDSDDIDGEFAHAIRRWQLLKELWERGGDELHLSEVVETRLKAMVLFLIERVDDKDLKVDVTWENGQVLRFPVDD